MVRSRFALVFSLAVVCFGGSFHAIAQQSMPPFPRSVPVENVLEFRELERIALAEVPYIKKMEVRDALLKVDGYDAQGLKVKLYMDRRNGSVLSREIKYDKHGPFGKDGWRFYPGAQPRYPVSVIDERGQDSTPAQYP